MDSKNLQPNTIIISVAQIKIKIPKNFNLRLYSTGKPKEKPFMLKPSTLIPSGEKRTGDLHSEAELHFFSFLPILPSLYKYRNQMLHNISFQRRQLHSDIAGNDSTMLPHFKSWLPSLLCYLCSSALLYIAVIEDFFYFLVLVFKMCIILSYFNIWFFTSSAQFSHESTQAMLQC